LSLINIHHNSYYPLLQFENNVTMMGFCDYNVMANADHRC